MSESTANRARNSQCRLPRSNTPHCVFPTRNCIAHSRSLAGPLIALSALVVASQTGCRAKQPPPAPSKAVSLPARAEEKETADHYAALRRRMVQDQLQGRDITDGRVLEVMGRVPRHVFVPETLRESAYFDAALPIGHGQTISQPYIVALMTQLARPAPEDRALDVGTGSGYQAAVLAELVEQVDSIEILRPLAEQAERRLARLGYDNVEVRHGDGYAGWPEHAPFDIIIVAAAPDHVPQPLVEQLAEGGRLVIPVGTGWDMDLQLIEKDPKGNVSQRAVAPVAFVPMTRNPKPAGD